MSGVHKGGADALGQIGWLSIRGTAAKRLEALERIGHGKQGLSRLVIRAMPRPMRVYARLLLKMCGIQHDQAGKFTGSGGPDDFPAKPAPRQHRPGAAMMRRDT